MSSSLPAGGTTRATTTTRSLFALALKAWNLCVLLVVVAALLLVSPAAVVILLPVACMTVSLYLLCAITARILLPFFVSCCRTGQVMMSSGAACANGSKTASRSIAARRPVALTMMTTPPLRKRGTRGTGPSKKTASAFRSLDEEVGGRCDDEQRRFYFVDTGRYCRTFYDLLAFWRSMERETLTTTTGGVRNAQIYKVN
ncbi:unnamed protein product [Urochloa decumbens]|uniref:Uncharacterized protein n=1 Tax=Urochloa decumbens TaxID=240449 RepID=A0ABC9FTL7_9POAL